LARTALKWTLGILFTIAGFFVAGIPVIGYLADVSWDNSFAGMISGIVIGSVAFIPGIILIILALIDGANKTFDLKVSKILEEYDRITPTALAEKAHCSEEKIEKSVSRIIGSGLIIVYFDKQTGEFVTQEGRAIAERVIGIIESKGRITLTELVDETSLSAEELKRIIVGMEKRGLFDGTYDWKSGKILSRLASKQLATAITRCPHCNGALTEPPLPGEERPCEYCGQMVTGK
jgi:DNA-binding MarR family transcriptional regulator